MRCFLILSIFFISLNTFAQNILLTGTVKDKNGKAIPGAGVYVSGYKIATVTDPDGHFKIDILAAGSYDILVESIGFAPEKVSTLLENTPVTLNIVLKESTTDIASVNVIPTKQRDKYIAIFKDSFIGTTANAKRCKILNPEVLNVDFEDKVLKVSTDDFLVIENQALGYRIKYLLKSFEYDFKTLVVYYEGYPTYEEMTGNDGNQRRWQGAREEAYMGSRDHFYRSLYSGTTTKNGFLINKVAKTPNKDRMPDEVINAKIKLFSREKRLSNVLVQVPNDSLNYWTDQQKKPAYKFIVNRSLVNPDTLVHKYNKDIKYINFTDELYVMYTKASEPDDFQDTGFWLDRPVELAYYQISQITMLQPGVGFYQNGNISNPLASRYSGYWAYKKVADQLPQDYVSARTP